MSFSLDDIGSDRLDVSDMLSTLEELKDMEPEDMDDDDVTLLDELTRALDYLEGLGGDLPYHGAWYPTTLIEEDSFEDFAREEAESTGLIKSDIGWPYDHIDWEAAADALRQDYSSVTISDGMSTFTYLFR